MDPRLKSSAKWSPFPVELSEQIISVLEERFSEEYGLEEDQFVVEGQIYPEEILVRVGLSRPNQLKQHNFEFSFEYDSEKEETLEKIQNAMDVIEHIWSEFLEEDMEDAEMPREWQSMPFQKIMYFFKYSTVNSNLEAEADRWLKEDEAGLYNETPLIPEVLNSDKSPENLH